MIIITHKNKFPFNIITIKQFLPRYLEHSNIIRNIILLYYSTLKTFK